MRLKLCGLIILLENNSSFSYPTKNRNACGTRTVSVTILHLSEKLTEFDRVEVLPSNLNKQNFTLDSSSITQERNKENVITSQLIDTGVMLSKFSLSEMFYKSLYSGSFIGFGGILTASVGFDVGPSPWLPGNGFQRLICGLVGYPISNIFMLFTGGSGWTGDVMHTFLSLSKKRINLAEFMKVVIFSYLGCYVGTFLMSVLTTYGNLPAIPSCINIAKHKYKWSMLQTFLRSILGSSMVCFSIYLSKLCTDTTSKIFATWLIMSAQVFCDLEHTLGTMFILSCAALNGHPFSLKKYLQLLLTGAAGNFVGIIFTVFLITRPFRDFPSPSSY